MTTDVPVVALVSGKDLETVSDGTGFGIAADVDGGKSVLLADD